MGGPWPFVLFKACHLSIGTLQPFVLFKARHPMLGFSREDNTTGVYQGEIIQQGFNKGTNNGGKLPRGRHTQKSTHSFKHDESDRSDGGSHPLGVVYMLFRLFSISNVVFLTLCSCLRIQDSKIAHGIILSSKSVKPRAKKPSSS